MINFHPGNFSRFLRSRGLRLAVLCFQFLWLNIVIPGHRRGIVQLPGSGPSCCESAASPAPLRPCCQKASKQPTPTRSDPVSRCAICFFAAHLSTAPAIDFTHPPLRLIARTEPPAPARALPADFFPTYFACGPPII